MNNFPIIQPQVLRQIILLAHLYTQKNCTVDRTETRGAASRGSISTGWPRKHNTILATQIFTCNDPVQNNCCHEWCFNHI